MIVHQVIADGGLGGGGGGEPRRREGRAPVHTFWFEIQDGKVAQIRQYFDTAYGKAFFLPLMSER